MAPDSTKPRVIAFYGFKGGAGRSLLLANVAGAMAALGKRVLVIDCDLEAPGVADYLDRAGQNTLERWRSKPGLLDLILEWKTRLALGDQAPAANVVYDALFQAGTGVLSRERRDDYLTEMLVGEAGSICMLGPGAHRHDDSRQSPQYYLARLLNFDWNLFRAYQGDQFLASFGHALRTQPEFHYVLIDARTGYNLPTVMLVQNFATDVVTVGTWAMQSMDGVARMMPVFGDLPVIDEQKIACHLVISKDPRGTEPSDITRRNRLDVEMGIKQHLLARYYHPGLEPFVFPLIEDLQRGDELFWARFSSEVATELPPGDADGAPSPPPSSSPAIRARSVAAIPRVGESELVARYSDSFVKLYEKLTGDDIRSSLPVVFKTWASTFKEVFSQAEAKRGVPEILAEVQRLIEDVEVYCRRRRLAEVPAVRDARDAPGGSAATQLPVSGETDARPLAVPTISEPGSKLSKFPLEVRAYAQLRIADRLETLQGDPETYDSDRIAEVRAANATDLAPVLPSRQRDRENDVAAGTSSEPVNDRKGLSTVEQAAEDAYIAALRTPGAAGEQIEKVRALLQEPEQTLPSAVRQRAAALLDAAQVVVMTHREETRSDALHRLGAVILAGLRHPEIDRRIPRTYDELTSWNLFDAFWMRYLPALSEVAYGIPASGIVAPVESPAPGLTDGQSVAPTLGALLEQCDAIQAGLLEYMGRLPASRAAELTPPQLWQAMAYVDAAIRARRFVLTLHEWQAVEAAATGDPDWVTRASLVPTAQMVRTAEAEAVIRTFHANTEPQPANGSEASPSAALLASQRALLRMLMSQLSGSHDDAVAALNSLRRAVLEHQLDDLRVVPQAGDEAEETPRVVDPGVGRRVGLWLALLQDAAEGARVLGANDDSTLFYRAALRWAMSRSAPGDKNEQLQNMVQNLSVAMFRLGLPVGQQTIDELKSTETDAAQASWRYGWWDVPRLMSEGRYRSALEKTLVAKREALGSARTAALATVPTLLTWSAECHARLARDAEHSADLVSWWKYRPAASGPLNDDEFTLARMLVNAGDVEMATGSPRRACRLFDRAYELTVTTPRSRTRQSLIRLRRGLAVMIEAHDRGAPSSSEMTDVIRQTVDEARLVFADAIEAMRQEVRPPGDREFAKALGIPWDEEEVGLGICTGREFPAPGWSLLFEAYARYSEILLYAGEAAEAATVAEQAAALATPPAAQKILKEIEIALCYPLGILHAVRARSGTAGAGDRALSHRALDIVENGDDRALFYKRTFDYCGIA